MKKSGILKLVGLVIVVLFAVAVYRLLGTVIEQKVESRIAPQGAGDMPKPASPSSK